MRSRRANLIRLAHANPELRPHLLPLLRTAMLSREGVWRVVQMAMTLNADMATTALLKDSQNNPGRLADKIRDIYDYLTHNYQIPSASRMDLGAAANTATRMLNANKRAILRDLDPETKFAMFNAISGFVTYLRFTVEKTPGLAESLSADPEDLL